MKNFLPVFLLLFSSLLPSTVEIYDVQLYSYPARCSSDCWKYLKKKYELAPGKSTRYPTLALAFVCSPHPEPYSLCVKWTRIDSKQSTRFWIRIPRNETEAHDTCKTVVPGSWLAEIYTAGNVLLWKQTVKVE